MTSLEDSARKSNSNGPHKSQLRMVHTAGERGGNNLRCGKDVYVEALAVTVLHVPYSLDSGPANCATPGEQRCGNQFSALKATQGQMGGFFSQLLYKCYLEEVESVGD